jgi:hypothetical protein
MKRGGSRMGYTEQFNLLSPCYKDGEQRASDFRIGGAKAKPTKKGTKAKKPSTKAKKHSTKAKKKTKTKQRGGSSCGASPSVSEMGVVDRPASLQATASELAWDNRMKGGDLPLVGNVKSNSPNLFPLNLSPVNTMNSLVNSTKSTVNTTTPTVNSTKSTVNTTTPTVNSGNSPLNKIKNELFREGTAPELVMKIIETNKNTTKPSESKYSFEIFYRLEGTNEIKKSVKLDVKFIDFLNEYQNISRQVFPPPPKGNSQIKPNATKVPANTSTVGVPANTPLLGGRKHKNNHK